jgi:hypothetical protein
MPADGVSLTPADHLMSPEEVERVVRGGWDVGGPGEGGGWQENGGLEGQKEGVGRLRSDMGGKGMGEGTDCFNCPGICTAICVPHPLNPMLHGYP